MYQSIVNILFTIVIIWLRWLLVSYTSVASDYQVALNSLYKSQGIYLDCTALPLLQSGAVRVAL